MTLSTKTQKGLLGTKLGMTQVWDENNRVVPVTVGGMISTSTTSLPSPPT